MLLFFSLIFLVFPTAVVFLSDPSGTGCQTTWLRSQTLERQWNSWSWRWTSREWWWVDVVGWWVVIMPYSRKVVCSDSPDRLLRLNNWLLITTEKSFWSEWNPLTTEPLVLVLVPSLFHTCRFPKQRPTSWPTVKLTPKTTHWWRPSSTQRTRFERRNYFVWFCDFNKHQKNKQKQPVNTFVVVVF